MKSQITKDFDLKSKLRKLADGGGVGSINTFGDYDENAPARPVAPPLPVTRYEPKIGTRSPLRGGANAMPLPTPAPQLAVAPAVPQGGTNLRVEEALRRAGVGFADGGAPQQRDFEPKIGTKSPLRGSTGGGLSPEAVRAAQAPAPAAPQPAQDYLLNRKAVLRKREEAAGLADGGGTDFRPGEEYDETIYQQLQLANGGRVNGPGGRTDDKVGPVMLSDEEYVLPGDTADAIGRDKLDAIRLATHKFVDPKEKSALRSAQGTQGLANGGSPWIVDPDGRISGPRGSVTPPRALPPPPGVIPQYGLPAVQQPVPQARTVVNMGPAVEVGGPAAAAQPGRAARAASALRGVAGGLATVAPIAGFGSYAADTGGVDTSAMGTARYLGRGEFDNAKTSLSGGLAEALADSGRGLAGLVGQTDRYDRAVSSATNGYLGLRQPGAANPGVTPTPGAGGGGEVPRSIAVPDPAAAGGTYQQRRLAEMGITGAQQDAAPLIGAGGPAAGRDILRNAGTDQYQNLGTYGGDANIYGRTTPGGPRGRINDFAGVGATATPGSGAGAGAGSALRSNFGAVGAGGFDPGSTNGDRFAALEARSRLGGPVAGSTAPMVGGSGLAVIGDSRNSPEARLEREIRNTYSSKGQGNMIRQLQGLRESQVRSADAAAGRDANTENARLAAETSRGNAQLGSDTSLAVAGMQAQSSLRNTQLSNQATQLKALQEAAKLGRENEEKGFDRYNTAIGGMFTTMDKDGKQTVDKARQEQFKDFIQRSDPKAGEKFSSMAPQEQSAVLARFKTLFDQNQTRNDTATRGSWPSKTGGTTNAIDLPAQVRESEFNDWWNKNLPLKDYVWSNLPYTNENVVVTDSGQPVLYSDYTSTDGKTDLDKVKNVEEGLKRRKSSLRSN